MLTKHKGKFIRKYSSSQSYNICRSCRYSNVSPTSQGDYVICNIDNKYPELGMNENCDCKEYKRILCWIFK